MAKVRATVSRRELNRRRSLAQVTAIRQQLQMAPTPLTDTELLEYHARLSREPVQRQAALDLPPPKNEALSS